MARSHAVVLGSGIAGLLAARVLADSFEHVTLVERDEVPLPGERRPGTPQDGHLHVLMPPAADIMEELHPGLLADLESAHVPVLHHLRETHMVVSGHLLCRDGEIPRPLYQPTRPVLEGALRARTSARVLLRPGVTARDLTVSEGRVVGVLLDTADGPEQLAADLVVDATGGALALPAEFPTPTESRVDIDLRQVTVTLNVATVPSAVDPLFQDFPHLSRPYGVAVSRVGRGLWQVSALGYRGHHPPSDRAELLSWLEPLMPPHWWRMLAANDWTEPVVCDFPSAVWRRWDQIADPPAGLLVMGDGLMGLNPVHAKGMTLAARQAVALRDCLAQGDGDLPKRFYGDTSELLEKEWKSSEATDRLCAARSEQPEALLKLDKILDQILTLAEDDVEIVQNLLRVQWGMAPASAIVSPAVLRKLVAGRFKMGRGRNRSKEPKETVAN